MLGTSECAWRGVACRDGRVVEVALACLRARCYNLQGTLPGALAGASALEVIDLRGNSIGERGGCWMLGAAGLRRWARVGCRAAAAAAIPH